MTTKQWCMTTPVANLYLVASKKGLEGLFWKAQAYPLLADLKGTDTTSQILRTTVNQLEEYFLWKRDSFDIPLSLIGTPFQKSVWQELLKIPFGKTLSYKEIAKNIQNEKAIRAVGTAIGKNPVSIIVPCHRVIGSDGALCGFAGGLEVKRKLLKLEQSI